MNLFQLQNFSCGYFMIHIRVNQRQKMPRGQWGREKTVSLSAIDEKGGTQMCDSNFKEISLVQSVII